MIISQNWTKASVGPHPDDVDYEDDWDEDCDEEEWDEDDEEWDK